MNDLPSIARQARANLAQALSALQEDNVPPQTQALASIVAEAMNLLHRIEKNHNVEGFDRWDHSTRALLLVRTALNKLQEPEHSHPTTESVLEPAAQAVGLVHQLNQLTAKRESDPPDPASMAPTDPVPVVQESTEPAETKPEVAADPGPSHDSPAATTSPESLEADGPDPSQLQPATESTAAAPEIAPAPTPEIVPSAPGAQEPATQNAQASSFTPAPERQSSPAPERQSSPSPDRQSWNPDRISTNPVALPALDPMPGEVFVEVSLGAYSTSNFYRHLRDSDVVDNGGLFVATYTPPELAQHVRIRATLTGGFAFEGRGTVAWRREMPKSGSLNPLTPPGFGLHFTELSDEARRMVRRYSRSREPFLRDNDAQP